MDDPEAVRQRLMQLGAPVQETPDRYKPLGLSVPFKTRDPNGVLIDVAPVWPGIERERIAMETVASGKEPDQVERMSLRNDLPGIDTPGA